MNHPKLLASHENPDPSVIEQQGYCQSPVDYPIEKQRYFGNLPITLLFNNRRIWILMRSKKLWVVHPKPGLIGGATALLDRR
jgi:hypothetical protein